jgi:hypothetical protein
VAVTPATFVADFPEFGNQSQYPVPVIQYYMALANILLNQDRWGAPSVLATSPPTTLIDMAAELFVAHHIVIEYRAQRAAAAGAPPGDATGPVSSKGVGPISVSYDTGAVAEPDGGFYNLTVYGQRFFNLVRMAGAGPLQLGIGSFPGNVFNNSFGAWPGPPVWPGFFWNT